jgi:hypothetical protein
MPLATFAPGQTWGQDVLPTSPRERESGGNAQATKGCRGTPSQLAVRTGPILALPGDRRREAAQGGFRTSVRRSSTGIDELRLAGHGGRRRGRKDLEGEQSPWETRAMDHWKRWHVATDSSAEQGLEVGRSRGGCRPPNPATGEAGDTATPTRGRTRRGRSFGWVIGTFFPPGPPGRCGGPLRRIGASAGPGKRSSGSVVRFGGGYEPPCAWDVHGRFTPFVRLRPGSRPPASAGSPPRSPVIDPPLRWGVGHRPRDRRSIPASADVEERLGRRASAVSAEEGKRPRARNRLRPRPRTGLRLHGASFGWPRDPDRTPRPASAGSAAPRYPTFCFASAGQSLVGGHEQDGRKRQGGNGRSDADTAADEGNSSKGQTATRGTEAFLQPLSGGAGGASGKRAGPQSRQRGATNPQPFSRRNPPRW